MIVKIVVPDSIYANVYFARGEQGPQGVTAVVTAESRLSDQRVPTDGSVTDTKIVAGGLSPNRVTGTAVITTDSRLSDARTPLAHAATHGSAGSDPVTLAQSQITNLVSDLSAKAPIDSPVFTTKVTLPVTSGTFLGTNSLGEIYKVGSAPGLGYVPYTASVGGGIAWQNLATLAKTDSTNTFTSNQQINAGLLIGTQVTGTTAASGQLRTSSDTGSNYIDTTANSSANVGPGYTGRRARGSVASPSQVQANDLLFGIFANGWNDAGAFSGNSVAFRMIANQNFTTTGIGSAMVWETATDNTTGRAERMRITGSGTLSIGTTGVAGQLGVVSADAARQGLIVRGAAGHTASLQEWQNSAGTAVLAVTSSGFISSNSGANFNSALTQIGAANGGGQITFNKQTAATTNPGANALRIYVRDGTNAGTLKLVVRAGAAGAETTILDNIPQ